MTHIPVFQHGLKAGPHHPNQIAVIRSKFHLLHQPDFWTEIRTRSEEIVVKFAETIGQINGLMPTN
jgi:hypothetical protein